MGGFVVGVVVMSRGAEVMGLVMSRSRAEVVVVDRVRSERGRGIEGLDNERETCSPRRGVQRDILGSNWRWDCW